MILTAANCWVLRLSWNMINITENTIEKFVIELLEKLSIHLGVCPIFYTKWRFLVPEGLLRIARQFIAGGRPDTAFQSRRDG